MERPDCTTGECASQRIFARWRRLGDSLRCPCGTAVTIPATWLMLLAALSVEGFFRDNGNGHSKAQYHGIAYFASEYSCSTADD
ncbi:MULTISPECIES: hypothetical protein [unclassified Paraburkholderia]|uniref:hypothetical protein n=1 Tax=unclassified Paraburkholderia TaxID=2615204 RepID=UPI0034CD5F5C